MNISLESSGIGRCGLMIFQNPQNGLWNLGPLLDHFGIKKIFVARLNTWAKCDPLLLNESNPLQDSEASTYWKRHDLM